jgi:hypothetical protein
LTSLSERYFRPKAVEFDGKPYEWLGVVRFKRLLMRFASAAAWTPTFYFLGGRSLEDVRVFEKRSRRSEMIHLVPLFAALVGAWRGSWVLGAVVFAANFHCFLLQRYNRIRAYRVLKRGTDGSDKIKEGTARGH